MRNTVKNHWVDYAVLGLSVFLVFCLFFESYIELPPMVAWIGRWHPVLLHFPIVLLLICIVLGLMGKDIPGKLLTVAVLASQITAISGFFLGKETETKGDLLFWHQYLGAAVAIVSAVWYGIHQSSIGKSFYSRGLQVVLLGLILAAGHFGGMVTHGEDFLALPIDKSRERIPDNPLIYQDVVVRILDVNCVSCHNPNKRKGKLLMTSYQDLIKGGKSGHTIQPGNPEKSELIRRLLLAGDDEDHMPPEGKKPLTPAEIQILDRWITLGATDTSRLENLKESEPLAGLIKKLMEPDRIEKWSKLPEIADSILQHLSSDYLTITRIANNSNALSISAFMPPVYKANSLLDLKRIADNIVEFDLSGMPIGQKEMALVASCKNLEKLEIDRTPVADSDMIALQELSHLGSLKAYQTDISDISLPVFENLKNLKHLYLWETKLSQSALDKLKSLRPDLQVDDGMDEGEVKSFFVIPDSVERL
jgi:hypothetical protein